MELILIMIVLAVLVEAVVQTLKMIWDPEKRSVSVPVIVSLVVGLVFSFAVQFSIFRALNITAVASSWLDYLGYAVTGILISRGGNFVHDLWTRVNTYTVKKNE